MKQIVKTLAHWLLPCALNEVARRYDYRSVMTYVQNRSIFGANSTFRDRHLGKRCFVLCNGPSINLQDLMPLRNEIVFSVSNGYHHKDYHVIRPRYHCVPQITYGLMTKDDVIAWFKEMDEKLGDAELFLSYTEMELIQKCHLFSKRNVNYVCMGRGFSPNESRIIDISHVVPKAISVPIMCLMNAMYMGFKTIYLLGTEHDSFAKREYKYFYEPTVLKGKDIAVSASGKLTNPMYDELRANMTLWSQYRMLKRIATANGISIYNATEGGLLDEFERVALAKLWS